MSQFETMSLSENESVENPETSVQSPPAEMDQSNNEIDHTHKHQFDLFLKELEAITDVEAKLQFAINFMEASISQTGTPHFKSFWEARNVCLQIFKENISPSSRTTLWSKYNTLSKEARRLKEILDEQSAFAVEQIEIAVKALETDIENFEGHLEKMPQVEFEIPCQSLKDKLPEYYMLQRQLNLLNTQAARITALRKELIRTDMRVRQKNKFFQRLSAAGDKVFPKRKELIKEVSQKFIEDVDAFIQANFTNSKLQDSLFSLREEIKGFQNIAKILTLNTHSFTHTRMRLSECWDQIKTLEKDRKKERAQQKSVYKHNLDEIMQKIKNFVDLFKEGQISINDANKQIDELAQYARGVELGREEVLMVREEMNGARKLIKDQVHAAEEERRRHEQEKENQRRNKLQDLWTEVANLLKLADTLDAQKLTEERDALLEKINTLQMHKSEKQELERKLKPLRDLISEKRESSLLSLSDDDRQSLQQYKEILKQRKERRVEIKNQIELLRKASGSSGLDFDKALAQNAQVEAEKERLEKINHGIKEMEIKISELEKKVRTS